MKKYILLFLIGLLGLLGVVLYQKITLDDGKLHLVICNVGQGDGILIRTPSGKNVVIDGGPDDSITNCLSRHLPFWDRKISVMMLTHPHADHLTGLITLLNRYTVIHYATENVKNNTVSNFELQSVLADKKLSATFVHSVDRYFFADGTSFLTVWPSLSWLENAPKNTSDSNIDVNGFSLVELLSYGKFRALLTGDAGVVVEDQIAESVGKVDVLKVPHHGSKTGMSQHFLSVIRPDLAVISVGKGNRYGHPSQVSLDLLKNNGIKTLRTDMDGEVEIVTDGKTWIVK